MRLPLEKEIAGFSVVKVRALLRQTAEESARQLVIELKRRGYARTAARQVAKHDGRKRAGDRLGRKAHFAAHR